MCSGAISEHSLCAGDSRGEGSYPRSPGKPERVNTPVFRIRITHTRKGQVYSVVFLFYFSFLSPLLVRQGKENIDSGCGKRDPEKSPFLKGMGELAAQDMPSLGSTVGQLGVLSAS